MDTKFAVEKLNSFPTAPGVYLMRGAKGRILYIGKAINLKTRVKHYFLPGRDDRLMIPFLIAKVQDIETIVVSSEKEALLLENTLIKKHKPPYNVFLRDDKSYIALKITHKHQWPMIQLVRYKGRPKEDGLYFGPYTSARAARQTFDLINKVFPLRQCSDQELKRRDRPCILYEMGRCIAPCVKKCTKEEYDDYVARAIRFLRGQDKELITELTCRMRRHADDLEFEKAALVKHMINDIKVTIEAQHVDKPFGNDQDVIGLYRQGDEVAVCQLIVRGGKLTGSRQYLFSGIAQDDHELIASFVLQTYHEGAAVPKEILLPVTVKEGKELEEILGGKCRILHPMRGSKKALIEMALINAKTHFKREKDESLLRERILLEMKEMFRLKRYPRMIECFDNSNLSGTEQVATLVSFQEGVKNPSRYRKYKLRSAAASDDYAAMREVLSRRCRRAKEEGDLPDLIIVDGGKGHLNIALRVLEEQDIVSVDVISLAKERGRHDMGATQELVFLPNVKDPMRLKRSSPVLFLLQNIRDEAHRTAISFQRKRRSQATIKSTLDEIPGIGPAKKKRLLNHFGSIKKIFEANKEELKNLKGISEADAQAIFYFVKNRNSS